MQAQVKKKIRRFVELAERYPILHDRNDPGYSKGTRLETILVYSCTKLI